jgi:hypothetical protein
LVSCSSLLMAKSRSSEMVTSPNASFPMSMHRQNGLVLTVATFIPRARKAFPTARDCSLPCSDKFRCVAQSLRFRRSESLCE